MKNKLSQNSIYGRRGRIEGNFRIYILKAGIIAQKVIQHFPKKMLHSGVTLTMTAVREQYRIPKLRQLTKSIIKDYYGSTRFQIK